MSKWWLPTLLSVLLLGFFPPSTSAAVVINEFVANATPEWVELYNDQPDANYIKAYYIDDDTDFVNDGVGQGANKHLLADLNTDNFTYPYVELTSFLNNGGDSVVLFDDLGNILDQFTFGAVGGGVAYSRLPNQLHFHSFRVGLKTD